MVAAEAERERREAEVNSVHSLESLGAAHYVPGVGFILSGPSADAPASGSDAVEPSLRVPYGARLDRTSFHFGLDGGYRHWSDPTGANTLFDFDGFGVGCSLRFESRAIGRLWTLWSDAHFSGTFAMGPTMTVAGGGAQISNTSGSQVEILNITGHVGLDVQPFDLIGSALCWIPCRLYRRGLARQYWPLFRSHRYNIKRHGPRVWIARTHTHARGTESALHFLRRWRDLLSARVRHDRCISAR